MGSGLAQASPSSLGSQSEVALDGVLAPCLLLVSADPYLSPLLLFGLTVYRLPFWTSLYIRFPTASVCFDDCRLAAWLGGVSSLVNPVALALDTLGLRAGFSPFLFTCG